MNRRRKTDCIFLLFVLERRFASYSRLSLSRDALVDRDPVQPGRDFGLAAKAAQVSKGGEKSLLGCVARVLFATQHPISKRKYAPLPRSEERRVGKECRSERGPAD